MNEQIELLAEQCYETGPIGKDGWPEYSKFNYKKFAELIVQECGVALSPMLRDMISRGQAYDLIKEHFFGVEE